MRTHHVVMLLGMAAGLTGCLGTRSSPEARFFQLQAAADIKPLGPRLADSDFIAVKPVILAAYLRQPRMAERVRPYQISYAEFIRWVEPLEKNITSVITDNLRRAFDAENIAILPQPVMAGQGMILIVEIKRFEKQPDGKAELTAAWSLSRNNNPSIHEIGSANLTAGVAGLDPSDVAAAQSTLLADLSLLIAADVIKLLARESAN